MFEAVCLVAPHGSPGGAGGDGSEDVEVKFGRLVCELDDSLGAGAVEGAVDVLDAASECVPVLGGGCECGGAGALVLYEVVEAAGSTVFELPYVGQVVARAVELLATSLDGGAVSSGPAAGGVLVEFGVRGGDAALGFGAFAGGAGEFFTGCIAVAALVGRDRRFECCELLVEVPAGDA